MKKVFSLVLGASAFFIATTQIAAHVVVKPNEVKQSAYHTFTIGVPNEKEIPTTVLKLIVPENIRSVMPNVKPGWKIEIVKSGEKVTEIIWTGGSIPAGQRDEFLFSAQAPAEESTVEWKAYQTYSDGTVVAWDKSAAAGLDDKEENSGPASQTRVLKAEAPAQDNSHKSEVPQIEAHADAKISLNMIDPALALSLAGVALGAISVAMHLYKRK